MSWKRARNPNQKAERVEAILSAAAKLFDERELADIAMRDIAEQAGLGKASLYHYFKTKEEVFISLYRAELDAWLPDVRGRINRLRVPNPERVAKALTEAIRQRPRFCRLAVVFSSVLEHNLSDEFLWEFKQALLLPLSDFSATLKSALPDLSDQSLRAFLFQHHAIIAGLWPLANPSPQVSEIIREEQFEVFQVDFFRLFECTVCQLLQADSD